MVHFFCERIRSEEYALQAMQGKDGTSMKSSAVGITAGVVAGVMLGAAAGLAVKNAMTPKSTMKKTVSSALDTMGKMFSSLAKFTD